MKNIALNIDKTAGFIAEGAVKAYAPQVQEALEMLEKGTGLGNDFLGWLHLPSSITEEHLNDIQETANTLRELCDVVVVAGIGGSYLGARAVIEALSNNFHSYLKSDSPAIIYAGHNISEDYLFELTEFLKDKILSLRNSVSSKR